MVETTVCENGRARCHWLGALVIVAAIAAIYGPTIGHGFVAFDDHAYILESPVRQGLTLDGVVWAFTAFHSGNWHPLTWLSHMLDVSMFGLRPGCHHLVSVGLHAANAVLLLLALDRLTGRWPESFVVATVFAVHPLRVESVAWAAERKDVLSGLFFMLTLVGYERFARLSFSPLRLAVVGLTFAAGLMAKPMLVTLPCVLLLLDWWPLDRLAASPRRCLLEKVPLFVIVAVSAVVTVLAQGDAVSSLERLPWGPRLGNAALAMAGYAASSFWPTGLAVLYPFDHGAAVSAQSASAAAAIGLLTVAAIVASRRERAVLVGWLWFCGMLVPVLGLMQVGSQSMADRYTYLPGIGLAIATVFGGFTTARRLAAASGFGSQRLRLAAWAGVAIVAVAVTSLAFAARRQVGFWRDTESLWRRAVAVTRRNDRALDNLAWTLAEAGRMDEAADYFAAGLAINPRRPDSANALGLYLLARGKVADAATFFEIAIRADPELPQSHANLGIALARLGRSTAARNELERSIAIDPFFVGGHYNLAQFLISVGDVEGAEQHLREVIRLDPDHMPASRAIEVMQRRRPEAQAPARTAAPGASGP